MAFMGLRGNCYQKTVREMLYGIKGPGEKHKPLFQTIMGQANSDIFKVVFLDDKAYKAKAQM